MAEQKEDFRETAEKLGERLAALATLDTIEHISASGKNEEYWSGYRGKLPKLRLEFTGDSLDDLADNVIEFDNKYTPEQIEEIQRPRHPGSFLRADAPMGPQV